MPLSHAPPDAFLAHIDPSPSESALASASALIEASLPADHLSIPHPSLPPSREPAFTPAISSALSALSSGTPLRETLDLSRYDSADFPTSSSSLSSRQAALSQASTNLEYLSLRKENLSLLETYGKNAWLIANSGLEDELRALERELEISKQELENVENERRARQAEITGEMKGLEEGWRRGVGRMIETLAAGERVRGEILEERKRRAAG